MMLDYSQYINFSRALEPRLVDFTHEGYQNEQYFDTVNIKKNINDVIFVAFIFQKWHILL